MKSQLNINLENGQQHLINTIIDKKKPRDVIYAHKAHKIYSNDIIIMEFF